MGAFKGGLERNGWPWEMGRGGVELGRFLKRFSGHRLVRVAWLKI